MPDTLPNSFISAPSYPSSYPAVAKQSNHTDGDMPSAGMRFQGHEPGLMMNDWPISRPGFSPQEDEDTELREGALAIG
ncbi:hypothetical protein N7451_010485 [Penicillium sp. IBT 35674x]|nr:hypothetical protein N7451_010485 [Penicillium sp. IBT 35674x]